MKAALYLRMSRDHQDTSIGDQRTALTQYAKTRGYDVVSEYVDEGISGDATEKRHGFQRMIHDAKKGAFRAVLCWDQDRFGRFDPIEAGFWIKPMRDAGVILDTIAQGRLDWSDFAGRIVWTVQQEAKHAFLRDLSRNALRGLIARAKAGKWPGGFAPFGYELEDDKLVLGESREVEIVREIFRLRLCDLGLRAIAKKLNQQGSVGPTGKKWTDAMVREILNREAYRGVVTMGGRQQGKYFTTHAGEIVPVTKKHPRQNTHALRVENCHSAIIDDATWFRVQAMRQAHPKPHARFESEGAPLSGLLYCGRCGGLMYSQSLARKSGQRFPNYICSNYHRKGLCGYCYVPQGKMLAIVTAKIRSTIFRGSLAELEAEIAAQLEKRPVERVNIKGLSARLANVESKIANATDRLITVDAALVPEIQRRLLELQSERAAMERQIRESAKKRAKPSAKKIAADFWAFAELLESGSPAQVRGFLKRILDRIVVDFRPAKKTARGQAYCVTGATIVPAGDCTKRLAAPWGSTALWTNSAIRIDADEFRRVG